MCDVSIGFPPAWILRGPSRFCRPPSSLLNKMCKDAPLSMYKRFFGCSATLFMRCGVESLPSLLDSWMSDIVLIGSFGGSFGVLTLLGFLWLGVLLLLGSLLLFLRSSGICIVTLLDFLFFCRVFLLFVVFFIVCIGFNLRGSTLLGFLVGCATSFHQSTSLNGSISERTCPRT